MALRDLIVVVGLVAACAPKALPQPWVVGIDIEGPVDSARKGDPGVRWDPAAPDDPVSKGRGRWLAIEAERAMEHSYTRFWQFAPFSNLITPRIALEAAVLDADMGRVEAVFADAGFRDASASWSAEAVGWGPPAQRARLEQRRRRVTVEVEPGPLYWVSEVSWSGDVPLELRDELAEDILLEPGRYARWADVGTSDALRRHLQEGGWPWVTVETRYDGPPEALKVHYEVLPGGETSFGGATWRGMSRTRVRPLDRLVDRRLPEGETWDAGQVDRLVGRLDALPGFSVVNALPAEDDGGDASVLIEVLEDDGSSIRRVISLGGQGSLRWADAGFEWEVPHVGGHLLTLSGKVMAGGGISVVEFFELPRDHGPRVQIGNRIEGPLSVGSSLVGWLEGGGHLAFDQGYQLFRPEAAAGIQLRPSADWSVNVSWGVSYSLHFPLPVQAERFEEAFGAEVRPLASQYLLHGPRITALAKRRDSETWPTSGWLGSLDVWPIGWADTTRLHRVEGELRGYVPFPRRVGGLAARVGGGLLDVDQEPLGERYLGTRFFLGDVNDVRGWPRHMLGPPGFPGDRYAVPTGGEAMLMGSAELRLRFSPDVAAVAFTDVGCVWDSLVDISGTGGRISQGVDLVDLQPTVGAGLHLTAGQSGIWRFELAYRTRSSTAMAEDFGRLYFHITSRPPF